MSKSLWMFVGSVPEDGDYALVWASDEVEAMAEGRRVSGYSGPGTEADGYEDEDFDVRLATATEIIMWAPSLLHRSTTSVFEDDVLNTDEEVRRFLKARLLAIQGNNPVTNGPTPA